MWSTSVRKFLFSFLILFALLAVFYLLCLMLLDSIDGFETLVRKPAFSLGNQALSTLLLKTGCSGGLSFAIGFLVRAALLTAHTEAFFSGWLVGSYFHPPEEHQRSVFAEPVS